MNEILLGIAEETLRIAEHYGHELDNLKLNFILYIAQCKAMQIEGNPLPIMFRATSLGPISTEIQGYYAESGMKPIPVPMKKEKLISEAINYKSIEAAVAEYGMMGLWELSDLVKEHYPCSRTNELGHRLLIAGDMIRKHCDNLPRNEKINK